MPNIHEKFLCEELDFDFSTMKTFKYKTTDLMRENYFIDEEKKVWHDHSMEMKMKNFFLIFQ